MARKSTIAIALLLLAVLGTAQARWLLGGEPEEVVDLSEDDDIEDDMPADQDDDRVGRKLLDADIDWSKWALQLPTGRQGSPDTIRGAAIAKGRRGVRMTGDGLELTANAGGVTTPGSHHARSEMRELTGNGGHASWGNNDGKMHMLELTTTVTKLPNAKPAATIMQIKDNGGNTQNVGIEVVPKKKKGTLKDGLKLQVTFGGKDIVIDPNYQLGDECRLVVKTQKGHLWIDYNGKTVIDSKYRIKGGYFKAGMYSQFSSKQDKGIKAGDEGAVVISKLVASHK